MMKKIGVLFFVAWCVFFISRAAVADEPVVVKDVPYVTDGDPRQKLDIYLPADYEKAEKPLPLVLLIHGGAWQEGNKEMDGHMPSIARWFTKKGYAVAANNYRLAPEHPMPAQVLDCKAAVRWLRANAKKYHLDAERFGAWGISAGGHLTAMLATTGETREFDTGENLNQASKIQAACVLCGPEDFIFWQENRPAITFTSIFPKVFGGSARETKPLATKMSPRLYVSEKTPPMMLMHAEDDALVPIIQAEKMVETLKEKNVPHAFRRFPAGEGGHVVPGYFNEEGQKTTVAFFDRHLKGEEPSVGADAPGKKEVTPQFTAFRDIPYVKDGGERQRLDIYLPAGYENTKKALPLVVLIHGGGWEAGNKEGTAGLAGWFLPRGFAVAAINYRFVPQDPMPAQLVDCKAALRWLRAHAKEYHFAPEKIGVWGMSAGGHLVALLGTTGETREFDTGEFLEQSSAVQAVCDVCGPTDFPVWWKGQEVARTLWPAEKLFGGSQEEKADMIRKMSSHLQVTEKAAPMLILHAEGDDLVLPEQSRLLDAALRKAGVESDLRVYEAHEGGHSSKRFWDADAQKFIPDFFEKHLKP